MLVLLRILLLVAIVALLTVLILEKAKRQKLQSLIPLGQYRLRIAGLLTMTLLCLLVLFGTYFILDSSPLIQIFYWTGCLILALLLIVLSILDVRYTIINYIIERRNIFHESALKPRDDE